jgi:hypothetical protein
MTQRKEGKKEEKYFTSDERIAIAFGAISFYPIYVRFLYTDGRGTICIVPL